VALKQQWEAAEIHRSGHEAAILSAERCLIAEEKTVARYLSPDLDTAFPLEYAYALLGDVRVARLVIQDGASFSGKVSMGKQVEAPPKPVEATPPPVEAPVQVAEPVIKPAEPAKAADPVIKAAAAPKLAEPVKPARAQQATKPPPPKGKRR